MLAPHTSLKQAAQELLTCRVSWAFFWISFSSPRPLSFSLIVLPLVNSCLRNPGAWKETFIKSLSPLAFSPLSPHLVMSFKQNELLNTSNPEKCSAEVSPPVPTLVYHRSAINFSYNPIRHCKSLHNDGNGWVGGGWWLQILVLPAEKKWLHYLLITGAVV